MRYLSFLFFFFNDTATTEIYTLSLHDALPISTNSHGPDATKDICLAARRLRCAGPQRRGAARPGFAGAPQWSAAPGSGGDRKSTRLNSSHGYISYAVFCLKKKKNIEKTENSIR